MRIKAGNPIGLVVLALLILQTTCPLAAPTQQGAFKASRDSLAARLRQTPENDGARRLKLLNNLYDIDCILGDSTYFWPLWEAAVQQNDANTIDDIVVPMTMRYMRRGQQDSVRVWIERNNLYMPEPRRTENSEYLQLRQDIQHINEQDQLAAKLIAEQVKIDPEHAPYQAMRVLYSLSVIANRGHGTTTSHQLKPSREYKAEALAIAQKLPFMEVTHFQGQILLGMSMLSLDYAKQFHRFNLQFMQETGFENRPFYPRRRLLSSLESLIMAGDQMPRSELEDYYSQMQELLRRFPNDTPCAYDQFNARVNFYYNRSIENHAATLQWVDSLINILSSRNQPAYLYKYARLEELGHLGKWEAGYHAAIEYMQIKDSLNAVDTESRLAELQTQYNVNRLQLEKQKKQQQLLFALAVCLLLAAFILLLAYHYRQTRRKNRALCEQIEALAATERKMEAARSAVNEQQQTREEDTSLASKLEKLMRSQRLYTSSEINRDSVAAALGTNRTYLGKCIQEAYGQTFPEYINSLRMNAAIELLEADKQTSDMQAIAEAVGYGTYTSFYRAFVKGFGVKPMDYVNYLKAKPLSSALPEEE